MAVYNRLPTGGKWELLWTNPSPTSALSTAVELYMDTSEYDAFFVQIKTQTTASASDAMLVQLNKNASNNFGVMVASNTTQPTGSDGDRLLAWRRYTITSERVRINGGSWNSGYVHTHSSGRSTDNSSYCIPLAVYGVKRLNLG